MESHNWFTIEKVYWKRLEMESRFKKWCKENKIPVSIPNCIAYQATIKIGWKAALKWALENKLECKIAEVGDFDAFVEHIPARIFIEELGKLNE